MTNINNIIWIARKNNIYSVFRFRPYLSPVVDLFIEKEDPLLVSHMDCFEFIFPTLKLLEGQIKQVRILDRKMGYRSTTCFTTNLTTKEDKIYSKVENLSEISNDIEYIWVYKKDKIFYLFDFSPDEPINTIDAFCSVFEKDFCFLFPNMKSFYYESIVRVRIDRRKINKDDFLYFSRMKKMNAHVSQLAEEVVSKTTSV